MKRILTFVFLLCAFASFSQTNPQYNSVRLVGSDSTSGTVTVNGTIRFNPVSGKFRFRQGGTWVGLGSGSGGSSTFTGLTDGPGSFSGKTLNYFRVNAGETALEYRTPSQVASDIGATLTTAFVDNETPSGTINGSNTAFTLANTPVTGSVHLYKNGLRQTLTTDYSVSGTTITFVTAPSSGAVIKVDYRK